MMQSQNSQHNELRSELSAKQVRVEQIGSRRDRLNTEIDESREQFQAEQESLSEARMILSEAIEGVEQDSSQREALLASRDSAAGCWIRRQSAVMIKIRLTSWQCAINHYVLS